MYCFQFTFVAFSCGYLPFSFHFLWPLNLEGCKKTEFDMLVRSHLWIGLESQVLLFASSFRETLQRNGRRWRGHLSDPSTSVSFLPAKAIYFGEFHLVKCIYAISKKYLMKKKEKREFWHIFQHIRYIQQKDERGRTCITLMKWCITVVNR